MKSVEEEAARWFARLRDAGPDHPDRGRFESWLASSPVNAAEYAAVEDVWNDFNSASRLGDLAGAMERRGAAEIARKEGRRRFLKRGVLGLFLGIGSGGAAWQGWRYWQGLPLAQLAARTGVGEIGRQVLPDGSQVVLGAGSHISVKYFRDRRVVFLLSGDAIFDVVKDPLRPFVVEGGAARATVLGTRFAMNRGTDRSRVSVESGRVQVENAQGAGAVILEAGQVAEVLKGGAVLRLSAPASDGFAWQRGTLVFDDAGLQEIAASISRYRRTPVRVEGNSGQRITAVVQTIDIEYFLQSLPTFTSVRVENRAGETLLLAP